MCVLYMLVITARYYTPCRWKMIYMYVYCRYMCVLYINNKNE